MVISDFVFFFHSVSSNSVLGHTLIMFARFCLVLTNQPSKYPRLQFHYSTYLLLVSILLTHYLSTLIFYNLIKV